MNEMSIPNETIKNAVNISMSIVCGFIKLCTRTLQWNNDQNVVAVIFCFVFVNF